MVHSISVTEVLEKVLPWHLGNSVKELLGGTIPLERWDLVTGRGSTRTQTHAHTHTGEKMSQGGPSGVRKKRDRYREILINNKAAVISWLSKWRRFVVVFFNTRANLSVEVRETWNSLLLPPAGNACGIHCILLRVCCVWLWLLVWDEIHAQITVYEPLTVPRRYAGDYLKYEQSRDVLLLTSWDRSLLTTSLNPLLWQQVQQTG